MRIIFFLINETSDKNIIQEDWWYAGIKGDGGVKSKGTWFVIEKE